MVSQSVPPCNRCFIPCLSSIRFPGCHGLSTTRRLVRLSLMGSGRRMNDEASADFTVVDALEVRDFYEGTNVPGEFRSLTEALGATSARGDPDPDPAARRFRAGNRPLPRAGRGALPGGSRHADDAVWRRDPLRGRRLDRPGRPEHAALAPQRGGGAGGAVGVLAAASRTAMPPRSTTSGGPRRTRARSAAQPAELLRRARRSGNSESGARRPRSSRPRGRKPRRSGPPRPRS